jgi:hypothetical protein
MTENLGVKTATKALAMAQRVVTLATPVLTVAVMMKEDGLPAIAQSDCLELGRVLYKGYVFLSTAVC